MDRTTMSGSDAYQLFDTFDKFCSGLKTGKPLSETLDLLAKNFVENSRAQAAMVSLIELQAGITRVGFCGVPAALLNYARKVFLSETDTPLHLTLRDGGTRLIRLENIPPALLSTPIPEFLKSHGWDKILLAPLRTPEGKIVGLAHGFFEVDQYLDDSDLRLHQSLARLAALAVDNALLLRQVKRHSVNEERHRLGRELHDSVSQSLFSIGLGVRAAQDSLRENRDDLESTLEYIHKLARSGLEDMRAVIFRLRPELLEDEGLVVVLKRNLESLTNRYGLKVEATLCEEPNLNTKAKHDLYKIALEALHNVVKHSGSKNLHLELEQTPEEVTMLLRDSGHGFDTTRVKAGGHGLLTMQERAKDLGANLEIHSQPGEGTTIKVSVPQMGEQTFPSSP